MVVHLGGTITPVVRKRVGQQLKGCPNTPAEQKYNKELNMPGSKILSFLIPS